MPLRSTLGCALLRFQRDNYQHELQNYDIQFFAGQTVHPICLTHANIQINGGTDIALHGSDSMSVTIRESMFGTTVTQERDLLSPKTVHYVGMLVNQSKTT